MSTKDFKTIDEQLEILRSRGLIIDDENIAKEFLLYNNYYLISGYSLTLRKNNIFSKSASFQNIIDIYNFDHEFRHVILQYLEIIEVRMKSIFAYEFTKIHGSTGYLNAAFLLTKSNTGKSSPKQTSRKFNDSLMKHI